MKWTRETLELAHKHSIYNRQEILRSRMCGCFYCGETFPPAKLDDALDWTDDYHPETTALCPECWIDAVIGDASGFPVEDPDFLQAMHIFWFEDQEYAS
ncbi:MAG: hypothetical protein IJ917_05365 [Firmicutes bacterium]|nr:hypothetical protein [Bacillota bacterium]